jgi:hypothetical protein
VNTRVASTVVTLNKKPLLVKLHQSPTIVDYRGGTVLKVFRSFLTKSEASQLFNTTEVLASRTQHFKPDSKRGVDKVLHLGCWRCYAKVPFVTKHSRTDAAKDWILANRNIFVKLNNLFYMENPELFEIYQKPALPVRMFGAWAAIAINCDLDESGIALHTDAHDFREGFCWTIPFGDFTGGELHLPKLKLTVEYKRRDVAMFQSLQQHEIKPFSGTRYSLVLFSHNTIFTSPKDKK